MNAMVNIKAEKQRQKSIVIQSLMPNHRFQGLNKVMVTENIYRWENDWQDGCCGSERFKRDKL